MKDDTNGRLSWLHPLSPSSLLNAMPRSTKSVSLNQLRVGIFVLVSIVILIFLILNASGDLNPFAKKLHLKARFADANGLREGSEVRLAGVRVGKVDKITLLPPTTEPNAQRVEALMVIDSANRWPSRQPNASAKIQPRSRARQACWEMKC